MKLISYSLFNHPSAQLFEKYSYIRIFYWNVRMNRMIYPEWITHLTVETQIYQEFKELFEWLVTNHSLKLIVHNQPDVPLCCGMIWRMQPCFEQDVTHVICRDADAITTYREAQRVQQWLEQGKGLHCILDNPAHSGVMGGMCGFDTAKLKAATNWQTWAQMVSGIDLSQRGSDQHLLNQRLLPHMETETHIHGMMELTNRLPNVDAKLWESNLTCRHIGSSGVVEMETIRFFKRFDAYEYAFVEIEKQFPKLFPWHQ